MCLPTVCTQMIDAFGKGLRLSVPQLCADSVQMQSDRGVLWADDSYAAACGTFGSLA